LVKQLEDLSVTKMIKKMLINASEPEESRVAIIEDGLLQELDTEVATREQIRGNIYKGIITHIQPGLQAAFVDYGGNKAGFLPMGEIHPQFYLPGTTADNVGRRPRIQELIKEGQEILLQVVKAEMGSKGAALTTYVSLPGRYLVLMPGSDTSGISRKIEDEAQRTRLREIMQQLNPPPDIGFIVRTAGLDRAKNELSRDFHYLYRLWQNIWAEYQKQSAPSLIYQERDLITRTIRDYFTPDIQEILVDNPEVYRQVKNFLQLMMPRYQKKVKLYHEKRPLFSKYNLEEQIESIYQRKVLLKSGGSIVIDVTEALVAIDVNSGRYRPQKGIEETAYRTNLEAAKEIAHQLRLRDLGGIIVVDFIDMKDRGHMLEVERVFRQAVKRDKARIHVSRISKFGLLELSRQRLKTGIREINYSPCSQCNGLGVIRTPEAAALSILRKIKAKAVKGDLMTIKGVLSTDVAFYLLNQKREELSSLEEEYDLQIHLSGDPGVSTHEVRLEFIKRPTPEAEVPLFSTERGETPERFTPAVESVPSEAHLTSLSSPEERQGETISQEDVTKEETRGPLNRLWFWRVKKA